MRRLRPTRWPHRRPSRRALLNIYRALHQRYGPRHWWPADTPFEVILGAILTQNASWKNVEKAVQNLKRGGLLTPFAISAIPKVKLARLIRPAGYFNVKAKRVKNFLVYLKKHWGLSLGKMFRTPLHELRLQLLGVNGIGEETADSILLYAGGKPTFVVDAYTRRVLTRHRYLTGSETYGEIQSIFTRLLPRRVSLYNDFHAQLVEVGKDYCRPSPRCESCPLKNYL